MRERERTMWVHKDVDHEQYYNEKRSKTSNFNNIPPKFN